MKALHFQKKNLLPFLIYLYLFLPFALFVVGWTRLGISIPVLIVMAICFYRMIKSFPELWLPEFTREDVFKVTIILFIIFIWVYLSGIGKFVFQNQMDHHYRNGIFDMLVAEKWPVVNYSPPIEYYKEPIALVYYFGFWLPPAIIGKLFGLTAGYFAQAVWALIGIFLFYYLILAKYIQKIVFWPLFIIIFFSGLDIVGMYLLGHKLSEISSTEHIEWWAGMFQFSSMTTQLFWVFNQAVPAWLTTLVLLVQKNTRYIAVIIALAMITCTLPFVGLVLLAICVVVRKVFTYNKLIVPLRDIFTFENIVGGGLIGIISFLFFKTNITSQTIGFLNYQSLKGTVLLWFLFFMVEAGIYLITVWKYQKNNYLIYYSAVWLAVCPWIALGDNLGFSLRTSIPALVIVLLLVIDTINKSHSKKDITTIIVIVVMLIIGSSTPLREITRTTANTVDRMRNNQPIPQESFIPWWENVYWGYINDNVFFNFIARFPK
jgi:hypothetical protein